MLGETVRRRGSAPWLGFVALAHVLVAGCTGSGGEATTTTFPPVSGTTSTATAVSPTTAEEDGEGWVSPAPGAGCPSEVVASIPVGRGGVSYELEIEPWGPRALAVSPDDVLYVLDGAGDGVVVLSAGEPTRLSLEDTGVFAVFDLAVVEGQLWVLGEGAFFSHGFGSRLVRFSAGGDFNMAIDLPNVGLSNGVMGLAAGPEGRLWVEFAGGSVGEVRGAPPGLVMTRGYPYPDGLWASRWAPEGSARFQAGATALDLRARAGFDRIGVELLGVNPDGSFVLLATESGPADDSSMSVAMSVRWFDAGGEPRGEAELPLEQQFMYVTHPASLGPDGCVYYLLTRSDVVEVLRMAWQPPG